MRTNSLLQSRSKLRLPRSPPPLLTSGLPGAHRDNPASHLLSSCLSTIPYAPHRKRPGIAACLGQRRRHNDWFRGRAVGFSHGHYSPTSRALVARADGRTDCRGGGTDDNAGTSAGQCDGVYGAAPPWVSWLPLVVTLGWGLHSQSAVHAISGPHGISQPLVAYHVAVGRKVQDSARPGRVIVVDGPVIVMGSSTTVRLPSGKQSCQDRCSKDWWVLCLA